MKKVSVMAVVVALGIFCSAIYGWSQPGPAGASQQIDIKAFRQFQKETLPLRDELMAKKLELRNEYAQQTRNFERIGNLKKEMIDLRTKIQTAAQKHNLPAMERGWKAGKGGHGRSGGCQPGPGFGRGWGGAGYGNVNSPVSN
jgi:zinc resistance-associated protein